MTAPRITERHALGALGICGLALLAVAVLTRACEVVVAAWDLGPAAQVSPAIRALDAGRRDR